MRVRWNKCGQSEDRTGVAASHQGKDLKRSWRRSTIHLGENEQTHCGDWIVLAQVGVAHLLPVGLDEDGGVFLVAIKYMDQCHL